MTDLIGKTIGGYQIVEQIGQGGMATIYKAYQPSLERDVAIKILPPYYAEQDDSFIARFKREAKAVANLRHPNMLMVMDTGEEHGVAYIVMEYVKAGTLKERMQETLTLKEIYTLISQLGSALDYAHGIGVIHRDVKPSNVLMPKPDWALLTDFGLAKMVGGSLLTQSGMTVGTPTYMSPEQGRGERVDHRTDIYSLGVILYEMVVGEVPYTAETPMAVVVKHITDPLPLPIEKNPKVPESLQKVILKALAKDPNDRYQQTRDLVEALKPLATEMPDWTAGGAILEASIPSTQIMPESDPTTPAAAVAAVDVPSATAVSTPKDDDPTQVVEKTKPKWPWVAIGILALLFAGFALSDPITRALNQASQPDPGDQQTGEQPGPEPGGQQPGEQPLPGSSGNLMLDGRNALANGNNDRALEAFSAAIRDNPDNIDEIYGIVDDLNEEGQYLLAAQIFDVSLAEMKNPDPYDYEWLGWLYYDAEHYQESLNAFQTGLNIDPSSEGSAYGVYDAADAMERREDGLAFLEDFANQHPDEYVIRKALGDIYSWIDDYSRSIANYEQAIAIEPNDPWTLMALADVFYWENNNPDRAIELANQAFELGQDDPYLLESLGWTFYNFEDYNRARDAFQRSLEISEEEDGWTLTGLAISRFYLREVDVEEIIHLLNQAALLARQDEDSYLMSTIGWAFVDMGRCNRARPIFETALEFDEYNDEATDGLRECR